MDFTATPERTTEFSGFKVLLGQAMGGVGNVLNFVVGVYSAIKLMKAGTISFQANTLTFVAGVYSTIKQMKAGALAMAPVQIIQARHIYLTEPYEAPVTSTPLYAFWS